MRRRKQLIVVPAVMLSAALACSTAAAQSLVVAGPVIERTDVVGGHVFVGTVKPLRHSSIGSAVGGRIVDFHAELGQPVKAGQPLAQILLGQIDIQIAAARAEAELRSRELQRLRNGERQEDREAARARMEAAKALADYAESRIERLRSLFDRNVIPEDDLLSATSAALAATNRYAAEKAEWEKIEAGSRADDIAIAEARVLVANEEVNRLEDMRVKHTIKSPFDGFVVAEHTEVGQWIQPGELVAEVVEVGQVEIEAPVLENFASRLRLGAEATVEIEALSGQLFKGVVQAIVPRADERSRSFPVRVRLENSLRDDGLPLIQPGMFARVWLPVQPKSRMLLVPKDAIVLGERGRLVYVVRSDAGSSDASEGTVMPVPVDLGVSSGDWIEVSGQLTPDQRVVVEGNERIFPGQKVKVVREVAPPNNHRAEAGPAISAFGHPHFALHEPTRQLAEEH